MARDSADLGAEVWQSGGREDCICRGERSREQDGEIDMETRGASQSVYPIDSESFLSTRVDSLTAWPEDARNHAAL